MYESLTYALSSLLSSGIDMGCFALLCTLLRGVGPYVAISTVVARLISASFNFLVNSRIVFKSDQSDAVAIPRYVALAVVIMLLSATFTTLGTSLFPQVPEVLVKVVVDGTLFVLSFFVQKRHVF